MKTAGFPEAFESAIRIPLKKNEVRIASLSGLVLLKLIAYHDRPAERGKDLQDILFVAKNYLDAGADQKLYERDSDLLKNEEFDYVLAGARILGRDLAVIMSPNTQAIAFEVFHKLNDRYDASEVSGALLREIQKGIQERL